VTAEEIVLIHRSSMAPGTLIAYPLDFPDFMAGQRVTFELGGPEVATIRSARLSDDRTEVLGLVDFDTPEHEQRARAGDMLWPVFRLAAPPDPLPPLP
jgi:hypothetical protein